MGPMMRRRKVEPTLWIDGAPKALSEIRSSGESPLGWIGAFSGAGDLAQAYRAGLTAYVAVNGMWATTNVHGNSSNSWNTGGRKNYGKRQHENRRCGL